MFPAIIGGERRAQGGPRRCRLSTAWSTPTNQGQLRYYQGGSAREEQQNTMAKRGRGLARPRWKRKAHSFVAVNLLPFRTVPHPDAGQALARRYSSFSDGAALDGSKRAAAENCGEHRPSFSEKRRGGMGPRKECFPCNRLIRLLEGQATVLAEGETTRAAGSSPL